MTSDERSNEIELVNRSTGSEQFSRGYTSHSLDDVKLPDPPIEVATPTPPNTGGGGADAGGHSASKG